MTIELKGPWSLTEAEMFLSESTFPVRLGCCGSDGFPRVVSLWYHYEGGRFYCVSHQASKLVALLRADARVGFEISPNEPPYHGVRGQGSATLEPLDDPTRLSDLVQRYLGKTDSTLAQWLLSRSAEELLITVTPARLYTWDYRERMADAV